MTIASRRRVLMGVQGKLVPRLPDEYQEVEWIGTLNGVSSNTTPYIRLNVKYQNGDIFTSHYRMVGAKSEAPVVANNTSGAFEIFVKKGETTARTYLAVTKLSQTETTNYSIIRSSPTTSYTTYAIGYYSASYPSDYKYYYFKHERSNNVLVELIPCYRKVDGVIGMYNLVNNTFLTNAGNGAFTKGANV